MEEEVRDSPSDSLLLFQKGECSHSVLLSIFDHKAILRGTRSKSWEHWVRILVWSVYLPIGIEVRSGNYRACSFHLGSVAFFFTVICAGDTSIEGPRTQVDEFIQSSITGANARCIAMLCAFKEVVRCVFCLFWWFFHFFSLMVFALKSLNSLYKIISFSPKTRKIPICEGLQTSETPSSPKTPRGLPETLFHPEILPFRLLSPKSWFQWGQPPVLQKESDPKRRILKGHRFLEPVSWLNADRTLRAWATHSTG